MNKLVNILRIMRAKYFIVIEGIYRTSLVVQWMSLPANAGNTGSIPGLRRFHMSQNS